MCGVILSPSYSCMLDLACCLLPHGRVIVRALDDVLTRGKSQEMKTVPESCCMRGRARILHTWCQKWDLRAESV